MSKSTPQCCGVHINLINNQLKRKTMEKKFHINNGYRYNNELGKLEWIEIHEVEFTMNPDEDVVYQVTQGGVRNEIRTNRLFELFANEEDFKNGKVMQPITQRVDEFLRLNFKSCGDYAVTWVVDNGVIKKLKSTECTFIASYGKRTRIKGYSENYVSMEHLLDNNDLTIVEHDGTERIHKSIKSQVRLTDEQQKALDAISEAIKNAENLGVQIYYDLDSCKLKGVNILNTEEYVYEYDKPSDDYVGVDRFATPILEVNYLCCDDDVYVTLKK